MFILLCTYVSSYTFLFVCKAKQTITRYIVDKQAFLKYVLKIEFQKKPIRTYSFHLRSFFSCSLFNQGFGKTYKKAWSLWNRKAGIISLCYILVYDFIIFFFAFLLRPILSIQSCKTWWEQNRLKQNSVLKINTPPPQKKKKKKNVFASEIINYLPCSK